jgi:hypothetical protein
LAEWLKGYKIVTPDALVTSIMGSVPWCVTPPAGCAPAGCTLKVVKTGSGKGVLYVYEERPFIPPGTRVNMEVSVAIGSVFSGWSGVCDGSKNKLCSFVINANISATAQFDVVK